MLHVLVFYQTEAQVLSCLLLGTARSL